MKKLICFGLMTILFTVSLSLASARGRGDQAAEPEMFSEKYLEMLEKQLELNDEQRKKVGAVLKDARPSLKKRAVQMQKLQKKMKSLREDLEKGRRQTHEKIRELLDYDQRDRFDMIRMRVKRHHQQRDRRRKWLGCGGDNIPPEIRERMEQGQNDRRREFPPEMWEGQRDYEKGRELPPELREHIEKRLRRRRGMGGGTQRDVPPADQWFDDATEDMDIQITPMPDSE